MIKQNVHVIIGGPKISNDKIKFRRRRLAEYLSQKVETKQVLWIYFNPNSLNKLGKISIDESIDEIQQIEIFDYKFVVANFSLLQIILIKKIESILNNHSDCNKYLWFTVPRFFRIARLEWTKIIYDCSDYWGGQYSGASFIKRAKERKVYNIERNIAKNSDICFASSEFLYIHLQKISSNVFLSENGVDYSHFDQCQSIAPELKNINSPILGFTGDMLALKISFDLLFYVATNENKWNIVLVGPANNPSLIDTKFHDLIKLPNVYYLGFKRFEEIPTYIKSFDLTILPYKNNEFNYGVFPLKFFEYLASGKAIVGSGLPATQKYIKKHIYYYSNSPHEFLSNCRTALNNNTDINIEKRKMLAKDADWKIRLRLMYEKTLTK